MGWLFWLCWLSGCQRHVHIHRWLELDTRAKLEAQSSQSAMVWSNEKHRARNLRKQYGLNALGKFVRKRSFRDIDYTDEGHLQQFDSEDGWIAFEAERHAKGDKHPAWSAKARDTVPKEQLALDYLAAMDAMTTDAQMENHQTRVHQEYVAEGLHDRHDDHDEKLDKLLELQEGKLNKQLQLEKVKMERANAKKDENEAFARRVEAGDGTTLEQAKLDAAKAQAKVRRIQEDLKIEKMREQTEKKEALAASRRAATAEEQPALKRAAKRTAEASTTEAKRRRRDPNATAAPTTEAREYKVGEIVKLKSKNDGKEFDGIIKSKEERGDYRVWVQELDKTILRKLPLRAASSK